MSKEDTTGFLRPNPAHPRQYPKRVPQDDRDITSSGYNNWESIMKEGYPKDVEEPGTKIGPR